MSDHLTVIADRYPTLGEALGPYIQRLRTLGADVAAASWLGRAAQGVADAVNPGIDDYLTEWNEIAALLDGDGREALSDRFVRTLPKNARQWLEEYADQFLDVVSELLAYGWLRREKNCAVVRFIKEGSSPEPDLLADDAVVVECKHFRTSQQDRDYFAHHRGEVRIPDAESPDRFLAKVLSTFDDGVLPKLASYPPDRFSRYMFADFEWDVTYWGPSQFKDGLVDSVRQHLVDRRVEFVAIEWHSLRQPLTVDQFRTPTELLP